MAALLIAMAVMAILLTVAMPTWKQTLQREKEDELVFRGTQYSRAISAYQRKYANASPPSFDVLIQQHYLRKKFKDPVSPNEDGEFQALYAASQSGAQGAGRQGQIGTLASTAATGGGIIGVASKNTAASIRTYNGGTHYNEWQFIPLQQSTRAGGAGQGGAGQGGQGGRQGTQGQGSQSQTNQGTGTGSSQATGRQNGSGTQMQPQGR